MPIRDPNCPKKPMSPFLAWRNAGNFQKTQKTMALGYNRKELNVQIAANWKLVSAEVKKPLEDTYKKKLETYGKLMKAYKQTTSYKIFKKQKAEAKVEKVKKSKFRKDENAPKRPLSGYFLFLAEKRVTLKAEYPDLGIKQLMSKMGQMWSALSESDKKVYNDKSAGAKKEYQVTLEKYKNSEEYKAYQQEKAEFTATKKKQLVKMSPKASKKRKSRDFDDDSEDTDDYVPTKRKKTSKKSKKPKAPKAALKKAAKKTKKSARKAKASSKKKSK